MNKKTCMNNKTHMNASACTRCECCPRACVHELKAPAWGQLRRQLGSMRLDPRAWNMGLRLWAWEFRCYPGCTSAGPPAWATDFLGAQMLAWIHSLDSTRSSHRLHAWAADCKLCPKLRAHELGFAISGHRFWAWNHEFQVGFASLGPSARVHELRLLPTSN